MAWLADPENAKSLGLLIFFITFCLILVWVYGSRKRGEKLEEHKNIPFLDDDDMKDKSNG
ncbi:MAG TPA: cbb3-type cytochrome c oxidase subunit 3 [Thiobacillaceae bacterium]|nr:cbb3-type cytochrome c oxidase subunit 3 [Thiobacillaceae bacterium]HNA82496.1 cbb3-type cytochrome c oxidase subunit 3 [Thiobacillaceae bacterium]HNF89213.1 cbb3-type cytochrome c oxidase subunit 3 [Thiobacillaceae bacterium]HNH89898.1 cbb3-type cytochrome c oxidase subunit 3 [Thiobacillaceae bacterium]HNI08441.1 cbb3-type cytochrome c oxidase subunit 3 [Thiobacillaceae bacterium]